MSTNIMKTDRNDQQIHSHHCELLPGRAVDDGDGDDTVEVLFGSTMSIIACCNCKARCSLPMARYNSLRLYTVAMTSGWWRTK
jgi:hypothetical protein